MRPRGVPSSLVKIRPWYYTARRQPSRMAELRRALRQDRIDNDATQIDRNP